MKHKELEWIAYGFIGIAILTIFVGLIQIIAEVVEAHKNGGDLATWVGAVGTVGTLIGAIVLSSRDFQSRERYSNNRARLTAAGLVLRISLAKNTIEGAIDILRMFPNDERQEHELLKCKMMLDALHLWSTEDVMPMVDIAPALAANLAVASSGIGAGIRGLAVLNGMHGADRGVLQFLAIGMVEPWSHTVSRMDGLAEQCDALALKLL